MQDTPRKPLRLWPAVALVLVQAFLVFVIPRLAPATPLHFFGAVGGAFLGSFLILLWWIFASRAPWRERLAGMGLFAVTLTVTLFLVHRSAPQSMLGIGLPIFCLAWVAWLVLSRGQPVRLRRVGSVAILLAAFLPWTLVRTNGVDGTMATDYAWRWSTTAEERFLADADLTARPAAAPAVPLPATADAAWPGFRGPGRDSRVTGVRLDTAWQTTPPEVLWRRDVGPGWSSFAVVGERLYTQEQHGEAEVVACYAAADGSLIWLHRDDVRFWEAMAGAGPRATPTYTDGRLYTVGATGVVNALDAATGARTWSRDLVADTGAAVPIWGFSGSPLVVDGHVIVWAGGPDGKGLVSYDAASGEPRWFAPTGPLSYSSPQLSTVAGVPQVLIVTGDGVRGIDAETGALLWDHAWPLGAGGARIVQPAVLDDGRRVLLGTPMGGGLRALELARDGADWIVTEEWTSPAIKPYYNDFVVHRGHLYGFDGSIFTSVDATTGERNWKRGRYGAGQVLLLADQDLLLVLSEEGDIVLVAADPDEWRELARAPAIEGKTWNHPVLVDDRLYVRNGEQAAALRLPTLAMTARR